jgi:hypothetical protein
MDAQPRSTAVASSGFELVDVVSRKRARSESNQNATPKSAKKNRQDDVLKAIGDQPVTERHILEQVGDNRYTREILRRLMALEVVQRVGKEGPTILIFTSLCVLQRRRSTSVKLTLP